MLLYGMDGDPKRRNRHTRFLSEVYAGDELEVEYSISDKKEEILKGMAYYRLMFKLNE
jgi:hypothetical protein